MAGYLKDGEQGRVALGASKGIRCGPDALKPIFTNLLGHRERRSRATGHRRSKGEPFRLFAMPVKSRGVQNQCAAERSLI